jgi:SulP family sulfate permease
MADSKHTRSVSGTLNNTCAALVTAAFTIIACSSFAALIFTGPLNQFVGQGIWIGLFTALVVGVIVALASSCPGVIAIPQDRVAPILALMAVSMVAKMGTASAQEKCLAVMAAIAIVSLITGTFLFVLGRLRLGNLIRYIPYPVIGGFLAGSGWLLVRGSIRVMTGQALTLSILPHFFQPGVLVHWLPGVAFAVLVFFVLKRFKHPLALPLMLLGAIGLFWLILAACGISVAQARQEGWLPNLALGQGSPGLSSFFIINLAPWYLMAQEWSILATILLTSVVSILLTASALELAAEEEIDLNRELRAAGLATVAAGLGGGMVGFHSLSMSRLVLSMKARSRWVGVASGALCGLALLAGPSLVLLLPQFVCGGLLCFLGLTFLWEWVYEARRTLTSVDYGVVILILAVVGAVGYPQGVGVGILAATIMFIHNYSRVDVVTHAYSGADLRSNVDRSMYESKLLRERGAQIYVLRLQGFIFFGTANHLLHEVRVRANDASQAQLKFVIMDFRRVTGLDASAIFSLNKVQNLARKQGFILLLSQVSPELITQFKQGGLTGFAEGDCKIMPDLDCALELCEDRLLAMGNGHKPGHSRQLEHQLQDAWPDGIKAQSILPYLERIEVPAATHLIRQSEQSESLYFVESGRVTARLEFGDGRTLRLRTMGAGTVVGEVGLFLRGTRAASVITEQPCIVYRLSVNALERMNREDPDLALAFHRYLICLLGERLTSSAALLRGLVE